MPRIIAAVAALPNVSPLLRYAGSAAYARFCRRVHGDPRPWFDLLDPVQRDALAAALTGVHGPVADLGCGPGAFAGWLAERGGPAVVGVDRAWPLPGQAVAADLTALPFAAGRFGALVALDSLYLLAAAELEPAVAAAARLLAPGGRFVVMASELLAPGETDRPPGRTRLGRALARAGLDVRATDLTPREHAVWRRRDEVLPGLETGFRREGNADLWRALSEETRRGLEWLAAGRLRRYLFDARNPEAPPAPATEP